MLDPRNATFYTPEGLLALAAHLIPGGVFAMWSDDPPDDDFMAVIDAAFATVRAHEVTFANPLLESESASTVYVARCAPPPRKQARSVLGPSVARRRLQHALAQLPQRFENGFDERAAADHDARRAPHADAG